MVSAASCIQPKNSNHRIALENIKVELGDKTSETQKREFSVAGILLHAGWDVNEIRFSYDFAMLKIDNEIEKFSDSLRPVCFKRSKNISDINYGSINGFNGTSLSIVSNEYLQYLSSDHDSTYNFSNDDYETTTIEDITNNSGETILNQDTADALHTDNLKKIKLMNELKKFAKLKLKWRESFIAGNDSTGICPVNMVQDFM